MGAIDRGEVAMDNSNRETPITDGGENMNIVVLNRVHTNEWTGPVVDELFAQNSYPNLTLISRDVPEAATKKRGLHCNLVLAPPR